MFPTSFFAIDYFAPRYFPREISTPPPTPPVPVNAGYSYPVRRKKRNIHIDEEELILLLMMDDLW